MANAPAAKGKSKSAKRRERRRRAAARKQNFQQKKPEEAQAPCAAAPSVDDQLAELQKQGHGPQRHEGQITPQQLEDRAVKGHDPLTGTTDDFYVKDAAGKPKEHLYGRHATKVNGKASYVKADNELRGSEKFTDATTAADAAGTTRTAVELPLKDVYGQDYPTHVSGKSRKGSKKNPTGSQDTDFTGGTIKGVYEKDTHGNWNLVTMYPEPAPATT